MKIFEHHDQKIYDLFNNHFQNDTIVNLKFGDSFRYDPTAAVEDITPHMEMTGLKSNRLLEKSMTLTPRDYTQEFKNKHMRPMRGGCIDWIRVMQHEWEPIDIVLDKELWDNYFYQKDNFKQLYVLHSEQNSKDVNAIKKLGFKPIHYFAHGYLCSQHWYRLYKDISIATTPRPIEYPWVCMNRLIDNKRDYRIKLLNMLDISKGVYSLPTHDPQTNRTPDEIYPYNNIEPYSFDEHNNSSAEIEVLRPTPINTAFLHIVNETVIDKIHLTEKIFKPIVLKQPFVLMGGQRSLKYLQDYGFKTFDTWWDEEYDTIEDTTQRMHAVADIANRVGQLENTLLELMREEMQEVLNHNYNWFYNGFGPLCWSELTRQIGEY